MRQILLTLSFLMVFLAAISTASYSSAQESSVDVVENKMVTLVGEGYDPDNDDLDFKWIQTEGESVELSSYDTAQPEFMAPEVQNGFIKVLKFKLTVTDEFGATSTDTVEIIVNPVNHAPIVDAGPNQVAFDSVNVLTVVGSAHDPDGDDLRYSWKQLSGQTIPLENTNGRYLTIIPTLFDYSQTEPLVFELTVNDDFGGSASDTASVYPFTDILSNRLISIDAGPIQTVREGQLVTLDVTGKTSTGQPISYFWAQVLGPSVSLDGVTLQNPTFVAPELDGLNEALLSFQVSGYSPGSGWANDLSIVKVIPSNGPPTADAGPDKHVRKSTLVKLDGKGTDPDGDRIRFSWSQTSGIPVQLYERTPSSVYFITPDLTSTEQFGFELKVTDEFGNSATDKALVTMSTVNSPPSANAGPDLRVVSGSDVTVVGSGADANGDPLTFQWRQLSGEQVEFEKTKPSFSFTAPAVLPDETKRMVFQLRVTDTAEQSSFDRMNVVVVPENRSPVVDAGHDITANEDGMVNLMCSGHDPDGDHITFEWSTSPNSGVVISDMTNPRTPVQLPSIVTDRNVIMTCTVSDGKLYSSDTMTIKVRNVLDLDIIADAGADRIVNEDIRISLDGSKSYDPENQKLSYKWTQTSGEPVSLSSLSAVKPSFTTPIVANNQIKILEFDLRVFDENGRSATDSVVITVDPVNAPPEASATARQS